MKIKTYEQFVNESKQSKHLVETLEPPYSDIFVSRVDLYQTYYDLAVITELCGPDYADKIKETIKPVLEFLENSCTESENIGYDMCDGIYAAIKDYEIKYGVLSGDVVLNKIAIPLNTALTKKDYSKFNEIRLYARGLLIGLGDPYNKSYSMEAFGLYSNWRKYIKIVSYPHMNNNELLNGKTGRSWAGLMVSELSTFIEENKLPANVTYTDKDGEETISIFTNDSLWITVKYLGFSNFEIDEQKKISLVYRISKKGYAL